MHSTKRRHSIRGPRRALVGAMAVVFALIQGVQPQVLKCGMGTARGDSPLQDGPSADALVELNKSFRAAYAHSRQDVLSRSGPVLHVEGDDLVLLRAGTRSQVRVIPDLYHTLKAISHVPPALYVLLASAGEEAINESRLADLRGYRERIIRASKSLEGRDLSKD